MTAKKQRNSNLELLRIIAMFLIVLHHFSTFGFTFDSTFILAKENFINTCYLKFLILPGKIGVNLFLMISAYFMVDKKVNIKRIIKIILEVLFYSIAIFIIFRIFYSDIFKDNFYITMQSFFPITFNLYWFVTVYILLMLVSPFLNKAICNMNESSLRNLVVGIIIICVLLNGTIQLCNKYYLSFSPFPYVNDLIWFISLYIITAYLKRYKKLDNKYSKNVIIILIALVLYSLVIIFYLLKAHSSPNSLFYINSTNFYGYQNSIFTFLIAYELFVIFLKLPQKNNKIINTISNTTLGIYLIHNNTFIKNTMWVNLFKTNTYINSKYLILYSLGVSLVVFVICMIIDFIRIFIFEKIYLKIFDYLHDWVKKVLKYISNLFLKIIEFMELI